MTNSPSFNLRNWLVGLGLGQYAGAMEAQDITLEVLPQLIEADLKECGVSSVGHRRIIMAAILALKEKSPGQIAVDPNPAPASDTGDAGSQPSEEKSAETIDFPVVEQLENPVVAVSMPVEMPPLLPLIEAQLPEPHDTIAPAMIVPDVDSPVSNSVPIAASAPAPHQPSHGQIPAPVDPVPNVEVPTEKLSFFSRVRRAYRKANGGSFLLSIGIHAIIILIGTYLVVSQVVEDRKISFGGGDRGQKAEVQHKVKMKQRPTTAPSPNKRITTTSSNAKVAFPDMPNVPMNMGPSISAAMSSSGVPAGGALGKLPSTAAAGGGKMAFTAFGFRGVSVNPGLIGHLYDLKQTSDGNPTNIKNDGDFKNPNLLEGYHKSNEFKYWHEFGAIYNDTSELGKRKDLLTESVQNQADVVNEFLAKRWDESILTRYYQAKTPLTAFQFFIPSVSSADALKAFGAENEVKPTHFVIHYKGFVKAPKSGQFRFRVRADSGSLFIRFNNENVLGLPSCTLYNTNAFKFKNTDNPNDKRFTTAGYTAGKWFHVVADQKYPVEILMENGARGFYQCIMIEDRSPAEHFSLRFMSELYPKDPPSYCYPVFALKKGIPIPAYDKVAVKEQPMSKGGTPEEQKRWRPYERIPEVASDPLIFPGTTN